MSEEATSDQLPPPPESIAVDVDLNVPTFDGDDLPVVVTKKQLREMQESISRLVGIVDALTTRFKESATAINQITDAINGLSENEVLLNAVSARIIAISENSQARVDIAVVKQMANTFISYLETPPATAEESNDTFAVEVIFDESGIPVRMKARRYDPILGDYAVELDPDVEDDKLIMMAINEHMVSNDIEPQHNTMFFRYTGSVASTASNAVADQSFTDFLGNAMGAQGAVGDVQSSITVSREYIPGSILFSFTEASEGDETPFTYTCKENDPEDAIGVNWKSVDIDINLAMVYISAIQSNGGVSGEEWYIVVN